MKGRITAMLILAVILLPVAGLVCSSDEAEAASDTIFTGIIEYKDNLMKKAEVRLDWKEDGDSTERLLGIGETNDNGRFTIKINGDYYFNAETSVIVRCTTKDVVCISLPIPVTSPTSANVDLGSITTFPNVYTPKAEITVLGYVKYEGTTVEGAEVTLLKNDETKLEVTFTDTDNRGVFEFKCVPGDYYITVKHKGFFDSEPIEFTLGDSISKVLPDTNLIISPEITYFGLDLPHLLTLFGMLMALILLMGVVIYVIWARKHPGQIRIIDDSPDDE